MMADEVAKRNNHQQSQQVAAHVDSGSYSDSSLAEEPVRVITSRSGQLLAEDDVTPNRPCNVEPNRANDCAFNQAPFVYRE